MFACAYMWCDEECMYKGAAPCKEASRASTARGSRDGGASLTGTGTSLSQVVDTSLLYRSLSPRNNAHNGDGGDDGGDDDLSTVP